MKRILPITLDAEGKRPLIVAFAAADVTAGTLLAIFASLTDHSGLQSPFYFAVSLIFGTAGTVLVIILLALPVFVVFHRLKCITLYSVLLAGAVIGGAVSNFFKPIPNGLTGLLKPNWSDKPTQNVIAFGAIGLFSALAFWLTWQPTAPNGNRKV
jgi:hypothetical protein